MKGLSLKIFNKLIQPKSKPKGKPIYFLGFACFFIAFIFTSCSSQSVDVSSNGPKKSSQNSAAFQSRIAYENLPSSMIHIPISVSLADVEEILNNELKDGDLLHQMRNFKPGKKNKRIYNKIGVWKSGRVSLTSIDGKIYGRVPLKMKAELKYGSSLEKIRKKEPIKTEANITVDAQTELSLSEDWKINSETEVVNYEWNKKPTISLWGVSINIQNIAERAIKRAIPNLMPKLNRALANKVDLENLLLPAWKDIQKQHNLSKNPSIWLSLEPQRVFLSPLIPQKDSLKLSLGLEVKADIYFDEKRRQTKPKQKLPKLELMDSVEDQFRIRLNSFISYDQMNSLLIENIEGETISFAGGKKIKVNEAKLYPSDEFLICELNISGAAKGNVYLKGVPTYNPQSDKIFLDKFDFDVETKNVLIKTAKWLSHNRLVEFMESKISNLLDTKLSEGRAIVKTAFKGLEIGDHVLIRGEFAQLEPNKIQLTSNGLEMGVQATGNANVLIGNGGNGVLKLDEIIPKKVKVRLVEPIKN